MEDNKVKINVKNQGWVKIVDAILVAHSMDAILIHINLDGKCPEIVQSSDYTTGETVIAIINRYDYSEDETKITFPDYPDFEYFGGNDSRYAIDVALVRKKK